MLNSYLKDLIKNDKSDELGMLIKEKNYPINKLGLVDEDENRCSLLMHACEMGAVKVVKSLLEAGVKINKKDADGDTALAYSVDCEEETQKEIINLLLNAGADVKSINNENETAIDRAKEYEENDEIVLILESRLALQPKTRDKP